MKRNNRGAALVEFSLIAPLLFMLVFGIIEFSLLLYNKAMLTNACREGARAGIVMAPTRLTDIEIKDIIIAYCGTHLVNFSGGHSAGAPLTYGDIDVVGAQGSYPEPLTVTVHYQYTFLVLPVFATSLVGPVNLSVRSVMRME